jgi:hypothetical protein
MEYKLDLRDNVRMSKNRRGYPRNQKQIFVAVHVCANIKNFKNMKNKRIEKSERKKTRLWKLAPELFRTIAQDAINDTSQFTGSI